MTANMESVYWKTNQEWWFINADGKFELTDKATERARKSFELFRTKRPR